MKDPQWPGSTVPQEGADAIWILTEIARKHQLSKAAHLQAVAASPSDKAAAGGSCRVPLEIDFSSGHMCYGYMCCLGLQVPAVAAHSTAGLSASVLGLLPHGPCSSHCGMRTDTLLTGRCGGAVDN